MNDQSHIDRVSDFAAAMPTHLALFLALAGLGKTVPLHGIENAVFDFSLLLAAASLIQTKKGRGVRVLAFASALTLVGTALFGLFQPDRTTWMVGVGFGMTAFLTCVIFRDRAILNRDDHGLEMGRSASPSPTA